EQQREREQTRRDIQILEQSVAAVGAPADVTAARTELARIDAGLAGLRDRRSEAEQARLAAERSERYVMSQQQQLAVQVTQFAGHVARAEAEVASASRQLDVAIAAVPESHRATASTTTADELHAFADELARLEDDRTEEQFAALAQDRTLQLDRQRQLTE